MVNCISERPTAWSGGEWAKMPTLCDYRLFKFRSRFHSRNVLEVKQTGLNILFFLFSGLGSAYFSHFLVTEFVDGVLPCLLLFFLGEFNNVLLQD